MRLLFCLLAIPSLAGAQMFSFGVKAGLPLTDGFQATSVFGSGYTPLVSDFIPTTSASTQDAYLRRYPVGPTVEIDLPPHLSGHVRPFIDAGRTYRYISGPSSVIAGIGRSPSATFYDRIL